MTSEKFITLYMNLPPTSSLLQTSLCVFLVNGSVVNGHDSFLSPVKIVMRLRDVVHVQFLKGKKLRYEWVV